MTWKKKPRRLLGSLFGQTLLLIVIANTHAHTLWATWLMGWSIVIESLLLRGSVCFKMYRSCTEREKLHREKQHFIAHTSILLIYCHNLFSVSFILSFFCGFSMGWLSTWREVQRLMNWTVSVWDNTAPVSYMPWEQQAQTWWVTTVIWHVNA